ncbi:hypothetical protein [Staphylococcus succinus]|uniref:Uncharacterized protein n=1 Tax=Staphylococcus succinus TaxID=61015 RepID=A0A9Q6HPZ0_9STAP|nr:hypothetical protein [Staphylococcus succinus]PTI76346.1 hypothetical protein BU058_04635 [Staphylococcus succinus]
MSSNKFIQDIKDFLEDENKQTAIVTGYVNTPKLYLTLSVLNEYFNKGIMFTSGIGHFKGLVNSNGRYDLIPKNIKQDEFFKLNSKYLNDMKVKISLHTKKYNFNYDRDTFSVYFPIGIGLLGNSKSKQQLFEHISENKSSKMFIITVADWAVNKSEFKDIADSIIYYDIQEDYPDEYQNVLNNSGGEIPF